MRPACHYHLISESLTIVGQPCWIRRGWLRTRERACAFGLGESAGYYAEHKPFYLHSGFFSHDARCSTWRSLIPGRTGPPRLVVVLTKRHGGNSADAQKELELRRCHHTLALGRMIGNGFQCLSLSLQALKCSVCDARALLIVPPMVFAL